MVPRIGIVSHSAQDEEHYKADGINKLNGRFFSLMVLMYRCYLKVLVIYLTLKLVFPLFRIHCNSALHLGPNPQCTQMVLLGKTCSYSLQQRCETGTGTGTVRTVTFWLVEPEPEFVKKSETVTGTVINYDSETGTRYKIIYLISFI